MSYSRFTLSQEGIRLKMVIDFYLLVTWGNPGLIGLFWHVACLPKEGAFSQLVVQDRVLTSMRLDRFGITIIFPCVLYGYFWNRVIIFLSAILLLWIVVLDF